MPPEQALHEILIASPLYAAMAPEEQRQTVAEFFAQADLVIEYARLKGVAN